MVKEKKPNFLFIMETISKKEHMERLRVTFGYEGLFMVEPVGRSRCLALFWRVAEELKIQNYSRRHINAIVKLPDKELPWKLTGFYGHPDPSKQ